MATNNNVRTAVAAVALVAIGWQLTRNLRTNGPLTAGPSADPGPRNRGAAPEGLPPRREAIKRVAAEDKPLTAYLAARALDGRPVEGEALERLQRADQAVQASRRTLMHGRGNVTVDVAATGHESSCRVKASHDFAAGARPALGSAGRAAVAAAAGAGVCDDFARVAKVKYAQTMQPHETLMVMKSPASRHSWVEVAHGCARPEDGGMPMRHPGRITVDGWAEGSALFNEDRDHTLYAAPVVLRELMHEEQAPAAVETFTEAAQRLQARHVDAELAANAQAMKNAGVRWEDSGMFTPTPAMSADFAQRVRSRMGTSGNIPSRETLAAVSAARAMGANVAGAVEHADAVLGALRKLPQANDAHRPTES